jgi:DNA polymerase III delta prime subunit
MLKRENSLLVEKYRPDTLDGYIGNDHIIEKVKLYIESQDVPHLLLYGAAGTGKTTLAKIITNAIDSDVLYINASDENSVDTVRDKVRGFASSMGFRKWKIIILDEADYLTNNAQAILRNLMETFSSNTRFILTCNYVEKIIDPIQSRCQTFAIIPPSKTEVAKRLNSVLTNEGVIYSVTDIATIVNSGYPDIRRVLNTAQSYIVNGKLKLDSNSILAANYMDDVLGVLLSRKSKQEKFIEIRQIVADSRVKDFTNFYRFMYDNVDNIKCDMGTIILLIADAQYKDALVVDHEINVMAMLYQIINIV